MKAATTLLMAVLLTSLVGATPLAIIDSKYIDTENTLLNPAWSIHLRADNSADYLTATILAEQVKGTKEGQPVQAQEGFKLESQIASETCNYPLTLNPRKHDLYKYRTVKEADNVWVTNTYKYADNCQLKGAALVYASGWTGGKYSLFYDVYCVYKDLSAKAGDVGEASMNFEAKFTLTKDDGTKVVQTVSSLAKSKEGIPAVVQFTQDKNPIAVIRWIGGVTYGEFCPTQDNVVALQTTQNVWMTANKDRYTEYDIKYLELQDLLSTYIKAIADNKILTSAQITALATKIDELNIRANNALSDEVIKADSQYALIKDSTAVLDLPRDHLLYAPDFQIFVRTDWLKLVYLAGRPKITLAQFDNCLEGSSLNQITVTVQNIGNSPGKFLAGVKCEEGITLTSTDRSISLSPQESGTLTFPFTLALTQTADRACKITVTDSLDLQNLDTKTVSTSCEATTFCSPEGTTKCIGTTQHTCTNGNWQPTTSKDCQTPAKCNHDGTCQSGSGESFENCGGKTATDNDCATCNADETCDPTETITSCPLDCGQIIKEKIPMWLWAVIGAAAAGITYYIVTQTKGKKKGKKKRR